MRAFHPGTTVGPYVIEAEIARGGMGAVFRARRSLDGGVVALKLLRTGGAASAEQLLRFQREGQTAAKLTHPGIVRVHDAGVVGGVPFIAMDLVEGEPLSARVGRLTPLEAARLVAHVARAIEHAHAHGVIHRDLKPDNVLVRSDDGRPVVTDFGIARDLDSGALTKTGALVGTPHYMSPEQAKGRPARPSCDVHALGALLYESITGVPPFRADDLGSLLVQITERPAEKPSALAHGVPRALDDLVARTLAKDAEARPSAAELAAALEAIADGRAVARRASSRAPALLALAASLGVALIALLATRSDDTPAIPVSVGTAPPATEAPPPAATLDWTEPPWLRALDARGLEALSAAHDALDASSELDPRARARAAELLARLDAAWTEPALSAADRADRLDALLWLHWLWRRVEPAHDAAHLTAIFKRNSPWRPDGLLDARYLFRIARASIALQPEVVEHYVMYANSARALSVARDVELLRVGTQLALRQENDVSFGMLARQHAESLSDEADAGLERAQAASARLLELAREVAPEGARAPVDVAAVLALASERAGPDEAAWLLDRAEALAGESVDLAVRRADVLARDPAHEREAAGVAEQALLMATTGGKGTPRDMARAAAKAAELHLRGNRAVQAQHVLERALSFPEAGPQAGLAMRLALIVADSEPHADALQAVVYDLIARLGDQLQELRRRSGSAPRSDPVERLSSALAAARSVEGARDPSRVKAALAPWTDPRAVAVLDP